MQRVLSMSMTADHQHISLSVDCIRIPEPSRSVGGGGYCDMFRGIYIPTGIHLALKRPRFSAQDPLEAEDARRRFEREGIIWATLKHLNILPFFGMLDISGETYLISPWLEHGDLSRFVPARLRFFGLSEDERAHHPERVAFEIFDEWDIIYGIVSGLAYLHENNVVHGDMKAANVLLDTGIRPVLCDFGMTKVLDGVYNATSTAMQGAGSFRWMSPEMLMNAPKSRESDIYAFGMTIVEVITGKVPFPDIISPGAIAMAITSGQRPTLEPLSRDQTSFGDLWMLASSCWDHNPDKRPSAKDSLNKMTASAGYGRLAGLLYLPPSHEVLGLSASVASKSGTKSLTEKPVSFGRPKLTARAMSTPVSMISYAMAHSTLAEDRNLSSMNIHDEQTSQTSTGTSSCRSSMISYATDGSASVNSPMDGHNGASFQTMARSLSRPSSVRCHATEQSLVNDQKSSLTDVQGNTLKILAETPTLPESLLDTRSVSPSGREVVEDDVFGDKTGSDLVLQQSIAGRFYYTFTSDSDPVIPQGTSKGKGESTTPPNLPDSPVDHTSPPNSRTLEWLVNHQPISSKTPTPTKETLPLSPSPVFPKHELEVSSDSYSSSSSFGLSLSSTPGVYESSPSTPEPDMLSIPEERSLNEVADCSSCGVFLDVFRYVCSTCGPRRTMPRSSYKRREIQESADGYDSRDDTHKNEGPSRLPSLLRVFGDTERSKDAPDRGYELCLDCIYTAGLSHALQGNIGHNPPIVDEPPPYHLMSSRILESGGPISASSSSKQADVGHHLGAPVQNVGPRHAYIESMWDSRNGWEVIRQEDKKECSTCRGPLASSRYKCFSCSDFDLCVDCYSQVHEIHPAHVFLAILRERKDNISSLSIQLKLPDGPVLRHENFHCHFCQEDIIGARFHCAVCRSVDVCQNCDLAGLTGLDDDSDQDGHNSSHIMIKIQYPLKSKDVEAASRQAFEIWSGSGSVVTPTSKSLIMSRTRTNSVGSAYAATVIAAATNSLTEKGGPRSDHLLRCNECFNPILGIRYQCANCPSDPTAYNLCENCEKMSFAFHHFPHVFIKFNRRVDRPIKSKDPLIPVLWKEPRRILDNDVQELDHMKTLCDRCMTHIRGVWYHCAICHADMCSIHEKTHDASHCFLVFKTQIDLSILGTVMDTDNSANTAPLFSPVYI